MSAKSVLFISLAVIAVAIACATMITTDSEAASCEENLMVAYGEGRSESFAASPIESQLEPAKREGPRNMDGPMSFGGDRTEVNAPQMMEQSEPMMPMDMGVRDEQMCPDNGPMPVNDEPMFKSNEPKHVDVVVPKHDEPVPTERIIEKYETVFKEKRELESMGNIVDIIDPNTYDGPQAELVSVIVVIVSDDDPEMSEDEFLICLLNELEEREMYDAADIVRNILAYRSLDKEVLADVNTMGFRSKDGEEEEDDIVSTPYRMEEVEEDEDAPVYMDAPVFDEGYNVSFPAADAFDVRSVDRGCEVAF